MSGTVTGSLNGLLADSTVFYQKLRHYHWNVTGPGFFELHAKFEEVYNRWVVYIDEVAERIIALDTIPLHTLASILEHASLKEDPEITSGPEMVRRAMADLETLRGTIDGIIESAEAGDDRTTVNLLDEIRDGVEADRWMLQQWLKKI
jgi:starvation-inducible DNA-binding protein